MSPCILAYVNSFQLCDVLAVVCIKMSRPHEPHRHSFPFGNPFRIVMPKGSYLSPKLLESLKNFEETLSTRLIKLKPAGREDVLSLSWMRSAMETLCGIHTDVKFFITSLEIPVGDWDNKWIDVYLNNSVKMLDICIPFSSEISRLKQGHLFLQCVLHNLGSSSTDRFVKAHTSLDGYKQHACSKNSRLDACSSVMDFLAQTLEQPKIKNSSKGKVLMRVMYGVKAVTILVCSIFVAGFSGSAEMLKDFHVPEACLWAEAFKDLQTFVNSEIRSRYSDGAATAVKELEALDTVIKKLYPIVQDGVNPDEAQTEVLQKSTSDLATLAQELSHGLDLLTKEVDSFFQVVLTGRDALLCNLRIGGFDQHRLT